MVSAAHGGFAPTLQFSAAAMVQKAIGLTLKLKGQGMSEQFFGVYFVEESFFIYHAWASCSSTT